MIDILKHFLIFLLKYQFYRLFLERHCPLLLKVIRAEHAAEFHGFADTSLHLKLNFIYKCFDSTSSPF